MNIFHKSAEFVAKHKGHHHLALASLALVLAGTGAYIYRQEIAQAATYTFTQASWDGGETANTAVHPTNQNSWSQYASTSADTIADANGVRLGTVSYSFTDDGTATTTSPIADGGGFGNGAFSGTATTTSNASIGLVNLNIGRLSNAVSTSTLYSSPTDIVVSPQGNSVHALSVGGGRIVSYDRDSNGILSNRVLSTVGGAPRSIDISSDGTSIYSPSWNGNDITKYTRATTTNTLSGKVSYLTIANQWGIAVSPDGNSVYASDFGGYATNLKHYTRNQDGTLSSLIGSYATISSNPYAVSVSPDNISVIVSDSGSTSSQIKVYTRSIVDGSLSGGVNYSTGFSTRDIAFSPNGRSVYIANSYNGTGGNSVTKYDRDVNGLLTNRVDYNTGKVPYGVVVSPDGGSVYITNSFNGTDGNSVTKYKRNSIDGTLSEREDFSTGNTPMGIAVSPNSDSVYITNSTSDTITSYSRFTGVLSGTFTSADIDLGANVVFSGKTLDWTETLSEGSDIQIQMRSATTQGGLSSAVWYGPTGIGDYYTASAGSINTVHNGHRWIQYQATLTTPDTSLTPTLDSLTINYSQYASSGDLTSSKYDVGSESVISRLSWIASTSTTETVRFQVQSSPDNSTWSGWCGFADTGATCDGSNYFTDAHNGVTLGTSNPLRSTTNGGLADRYFQYKVFLVSGGAVTPELTSVTVQYVLNAPPLAGNVVVSQVIDPLDENYGKVSFSFDVSDEDTSSGSPENQYKLTPTLYQYSTDGVSFSTISSGLGANAYSVINLSGDSSTTTTSVLWTPHSDIALTSNAKIRVTVTDGEAANFSAVATSGTFSLDTTAPVVASVGGFLVDSSIGGSGLAGIKLFATDASTMQYRLCNNADFSTDGLNSGAGKCAEWSTLASSPVSLATSTTSWNTALGADSTEKVYMEVRDLYGNVTSMTATAPAMPSNFLTTDTTNITDGTYREFLSWGVATSTGFGSYQVWYRLDGETNYSPLGGPITPNTQNYYTHTITTATSSVHNYKVVTISANGDISEFTAPTSDKPDGSGSADTTPPYIASIAALSVRNTSANITFVTASDSTLAPPGELATSTVRYASYLTGDPAPTACPTANSVSSNTYVVNHSVYLTGLEPSTNYVFCVLAKNIAGYTSTPSSVSSAGGTFTTIGGPRITGVTQREVTDTSATIFWNTDTSSDSKVYFSTSAGGVNGATPVTGAVVTTSGTRENETFYQHQIGLTGLTPGLTYYYKVSSTDALDSELVAVDDNTGQYYSFVTLKDTTPPTIMGTSTPVLAPDSAVIVWQTNELASTKVEYGLTDSYGTISEDVSDPLSIYHVRAITALTKKTLYYYRVTSKDAANNEATATGTFTTPADGNVTITVVRVTQTSEGTPPDTTAPAISNVKVSDITPFGATVSFDTNEDAVSFVDYGKSVTYGDSSGSKAWSKTHSIKLRGLTLGTEYFIKVSAVDKAGNTGTGGEQTFKTTFLSENLKDMANVENIEQFQKEIESAIESILPSLVPPFITKPVISEITENGAKISFRTNIKAFPVVVFAEDGVFDETKENPYTGEMSDTTEKATSHEIALTGLKGNTKYHIQARGFSLPKVIGKSADVTFITKASKIAGSIVERKKDSFTVVWTTEEPTSSIVEFKDLKRGITGRKTDDAKKKSHSMKIENLPSGTAYEVNLSGVTEQGNIAEAGSPISVTTSTDVTAPVISGFKVDNALVPGRTDRIQTIVTWVTDEPSDSTVYYQEGAGSPGDTEELANKNEVLDSYITNHSVILPSLKPGTIYRLKVTSRDDSGNLGSFGPRTVITPKQTESITDIIFKNFEDSFKFLQKI